MELGKLTDKDVITLYSDVIKELKHREIIRTNNVVGDLGEHLAIEVFNNNPSLPNLAPAPIGTENIDAISRKGDRYSIKSTTTNTTGVFYGMEPKGSNKKDPRKFEYVLICKFDGDYTLQMILELTWDQFQEYKKWHSRALAWNLSLTKELIGKGRIVYSIKP